MSSWIGRVIAFMTLVAASAFAVGGPGTVVARQASPVAATPCPATSEEENVALVRRFIDEVYVAGDPAQVAAFLSDDFNRTNPARPTRNEPGTADDAARVERSLREFPDYQVDIEQIMADGDKVMVLQRISGTHQGAFDDLGVPATGRKAEWQTVIIWRVACGQLVENWVVTDRLTEYQQLGIITGDELATVGTPTVATPVP